MGVELEELRCVLYSAHTERKSSPPLRIITPSSVPLPTPLYKVDDWVVESTVDNLESVTSVFYKGELSWINRCIGKLHNKQFDFDRIWNLLYEVLVYTDFEFPVRGSRRFEAPDKLLYTNEWAGRLELFTGYEQVDNRRGLLYTGIYSGGLAKYMN